GTVSCAGFFLPRLFSGMFSPTSPSTSRPSAMIRLHLLPLLLVQLMLLPLAACAQSSAAPVEGQDYVVIPDGQRWSTADDKIEVVEVFAYTCHHCADFEPALAAWKRRQPADVRV